MSLRVWLPLISDLHNQGVSGLTPVQTTAPTWVDGKLGKAMSTGALYLPANDVAKFYNNNAMSFAFWIYAVGSSGSSVILGQSNMSVGNNRMFTIFQYPSPNDLHLSWQSNESSTTFLGGSLYGVFPSGTWTHCAITYDGAKATVYINGVYQTSWNGVSTRTNFTYDVPIPSTSIRYLNDFRIYDHALSPKEIKLLSQGLVCHYTLGDRSIQQMNNCYVYPTFDTSSSNGGWYHWGRTGHAGSYSQNTDPKFIFTPGQTYSHCVSNAATATGEYLCYQSPEFDGGYRSLCCIIKESNSLPITEDIAFPDWNANVSSGAPLHKWTSIISIGNGFYLCKVEGLQQSGSNDLVGIYVCPGYTIYITCAYLENNRTVCSDIFYNTDIVYDCSGYNYHGTKSGTLTVDSNTPRYSVSTQFSSGSHINTTLVTGGFTNTYTFAWWGYIVNYTGHMMWGFSNGNRLNLYMANGGNNFYWNTGDGNNNPFGSIKPSDYKNAWHYFTVTGDGTTTKLYIDGEFKANATTYKGITGTTIYFNGWDSGTSYNCNGKLSDFRIYATPLSADDIKELYQTSASIDKDGNLYAYELKEE